VDQSVGRVLDLFGLESPLVKRWGEPAAEHGKVVRATGRPAKE
jgi:hypothetical protein